MNDDLRKLDAALLNIQDEIAPKRDLWPEINARISERKERFWHWRLAASGVAAALLVANMIVPERDGDLVADVQATPVPSLGQDLVRHIGFDSDFLREYERQLAALDEQLDRLPPGTRDVVIGNLKVIRASIAEINAAIDEEPGNVQLRQLLQLAYKQELSVLSTVRDSASTVDRVRTTI
ncbi:MAG: hypothetical protein AAF270_16375 [Pseudomonadota bacterium]